MIKVLLSVVVLALVGCTAQQNHKIQNETIRQTSDVLPIKIKQGAPYAEARSILINDGWQIVVMHKRVNGTPVCWYDYEENPSLWSCNYKEIGFCSGTGMGFCDMWFFDGYKKYLMVQTYGGRPESLEDKSVIVNNWEIQDKPPEIEVRDKAQRILSK